MEAGRQDAKDNVIQACRIFDGFLSAAIRIILEMGIAGQIKIDIIESRQPWTAIQAKNEIKTTHKFDGRELPSQECKLSSEPEILPPAPDVSSTVDALVASRSTFRDLSNLERDDPLYKDYEAAGEFALESKAPLTQLAYKSDWKLFKIWCLQHNLCSLPATPNTVVLYIAHLARKRENGGKGLKPATIARRLTSINTMHKDKKLDSPATMNNRLLAATFQGIRRTLGTAQTMKKPLTRNRLVKVINHLEGPVAAARDKAMLLIGFAGALRRSELVAFQVKDIVEHRKGITIKVPRSKVDQEGKGAEVEILWGVNDKTCPVLALKNWLAVSGIKDGFVFRAVGRYGNIGKPLKPASAAWIIKKLVDKAGVENAKEYGGHSLRAGFVTEASANGATDRQIMKQTGHKSVAMVHRYTREDQTDRQNAESKLGL